MTIGERIKKARENCGLTQTELADAIGTTKQNIYKYENGIVTNIPSDKIEMISKICKVSPAYLMGWNDFGTVHLPSTEAEDLSDSLVSETFKIRLSNPEEFVTFLKRLFSETFHITDSELESLTLQNIEEKTLEIKKLTERALNEENILTLYHALNIGGKLEALKYLEQLNSIDKYTS